MNISALYKRIYSKICGSHPNPSLLHFQYLATYQHTPLLKKTLNTRSGDIIDFGCGAKPYKSWFGSYNTYVGVDMYQAPEVDVLVDNGRIPLDDNTFDIALATQVFEHTDTLEYLGELHRVLKPGGELILSVPFLYHVHHEHDYRRFTKEGIFTTLSSYGFEVSQYETLGGYGSTTSVLVLSFIQERLGKSLAGKILKVIITPAFIPLSYIYNIRGIILDKIDTTDRFYNNQFVIVKKI